MGLRALNNPNSSFEDVFSNTGILVAAAPPVDIPIDIDDTDLQHYWNAIPAAVSGNVVTDSTGSGNDITAQWSVSYDSVTRGGEIPVTTDDSTGYFAFGSDVTFGSGYTDQEWTFFWCGERSETAWWMWATGSDANNFLGYSGSSLRLDSNQDVKGDLTGYSSMSNDTLYCVYVTMASNGAMEWYVNGSSVGSTTYDGTWSNDNVIFDSLNHYDGSGSLQTGGKYYFAGFYSRVLSGAEVSTNWTAHETRLGI